MDAGRTRSSGRVADRRAARVVALLVLSVAAACGGGSGSEVSGPGPSAPAPTTGAAPTTGGGPTGPDPSADEASSALPPGPPASSAAPPSTSAPSGPVTLAVAGDTYGFGLRGDVAAGIAGRLAPMAPVLGAADVAVLNLETAITERGEPVPKAFTFRAPPTILDGIALAGVDAVSMANNHGMDFGPEGLEDSLAARAAAPLDVIGIGVDEADALAPARFEVRGTRLAVIAATQVLDSDVIDEWTATPSSPGLASAKRVDTLVAAVEEARARGEVVVVFLHWGVEGEHCPSGSQVELAEALAEAGAAAVVGAHSHRLQGGGFSGSTYVHYGLGNFAFLARSAPARATGVLTLTIDGERVTAGDWTPGVIEDSSPRPLEGPAADEARRTWEALRGCAGLAATPG